jgi:hypothetical protein
MLTGALLGILHEAAQAVLTLTDDVSAERLAALRLTRDEVVRQLLVIADTSLNLPAPDRAALSGIDWQAWPVVASMLRSADLAARHEALDFALRSLVPALILGLALYRKSRPELFRLIP